MHRVDISVCNVADQLDANVSAFYSGLKRPGKARRNSPDSWGGKLTHARVVSANQAESNGIDPETKTEVTGSRGNGPEYKVQQGHGTLACLGVVDGDGFVRVHMAMWRVSPRGGFAWSRKRTEAAAFRVSALPRRLTRNALASLGFALSALFAYLAVRGVRFDAVWTTLRESDAWWLVPSIGALAVANVLRAYRWQLLFRHETRPAFGCVMRAMLIGQFLNNVLPARAGEAARIISLNRASGTSRVETAGTVFIERAYDVLSVLLLLFAMLPWLPPVSWLRAAAVVAIVLVVALLAAAAVLARFRDRPVRILLRPLAALPFLSLESTHRAAENLVHGLAGISRPRMALTALLLTTSSWVALGLSAWLLMRGFGFGRGLPPSAAMLVVIAAALAMILPSSPAAVGVFEGATLVALGAYGIASSEALSYAVALHVVNLLPYIVVGLPLLNTHTAGMTRRARGSSDARELHRAGLQ